MFGEKIRPKTSAWLSAMTVERELLPSKNRHVQIEMCMADSSLDTTSKIYVCLLEIMAPRSHWQYRLRSGRGALVYYLEDSQSPLRHANPRPPLALSGTAVFELTRSSKVSPQRFTSAISGVRVGSSILQRNAKEHVYLYIRFPTPFPRQRFIKDPRQSP
jgi:hypothetical protein